MDPNEPFSPGRALLVSDFDGTMTRNDFYKLARASLLPGDAPDHWDEYQAGRLTHFEALRAIFASIRADEATVRAVVDRMELDPDLARGLERLRAAGWDVVITSAGCEWYIRLLLAKAGVDVRIWANPGRFEEGRGLLMSLPEEGPFFSRNLGVDKAAVVRRAIAGGGPVAFAGDSLPDLDPALLVPPDLRFARADLAEALEARGVPYRPFDRWSEIAEVLCERPTTEPGA